MKLVLLPGLDGSGNLFDPLIPCLGNQVTPLVVRYPPDQKMAYEELQQYVETLLPADEPYILLGESFSGPIAISIAASQPENLCALILCCTFSSRPLTRIPGARMFTKLLPVQNSPELLIKFFLTGFHPKDKLVSDIQTILKSVDRRVLADRLNLVLEVDYSDKLSEITVPTLYLQARNDHLVSSQVGLDVVEKINNVNLVTLEGPHGLLQVNPHESASAIKQFIEDKLSR